jgi:hypothetical protein
MRKFIGKARQYLRTYWCNLMHSREEHMSRGAEHVNKMITWARGDGWRRRNRHHKKS